MKTYLSTQIPPCSLGKMGTIQVLYKGVWPSSPVISIIYHGKQWCYGPKVPVLWFFYSIIEHFDNGRVIAVVSTKTQIKYFKTVVIVKKVFSCWNIAFLITILMKDRVEIGL